MLLTKRVDDGGFLVGDTATRRAAYASPNSPEGHAAFAEPRRQWEVAEAMLARLGRVDEREERWLKVLIASSTGSGFPRWQGPERT